MVVSCCIKQLDGKFEFFVVLDGRFEELEFVKITDRDSSFFSEGMDSSVGFQEVVEVRETAQRCGQLLSFDLQLGSDHVSIELIDARINSLYRHIDSLAGSTNFAEGFCIKGVEEGVSEFSDCALFRIPQKKISFVSFPLPLIVGECSSRLDWCWDCDLGEFGYSCRRKFGPEICVAENVAQQSSTVLGVVEGVMGHALDVVFPVRESQAVS